MLPSHLIQVSMVVTCLFVLSGRRRLLLQAQSSGMLFVSVVQETKHQGSACSGQSRLCCQRPQACWLRPGQGKFAGQHMPLQSQCWWPLTRARKAHECSNLLTAGPCSKAAQAGTGCLAAAGCPGGLPDRSASPARHQLQGSGGAVQVRRVHADTGSSCCKHVSTPADRPVHSALHSCSHLPSHSFLTRGQHKMVGDKSLAWPHVHVRLRHHSVIYTAPQAGAAVNVLQASLWQCLQKRPPRGGASRAGVPGSTGSAAAHRGGQGRWRRAQ